MNLVLDQKHLNGFFPLLISPLLTVQVAQTKPDRGIVRGQIKNFFINLNRLIQISEIDIQAGEQELTVNIIGIFGDGLSEPLGGGMGFPHFQKKNGKFLQHIIGIRITDKRLFIRLLGFTIFFITLGMGSPQKIKIGAGQISFFVGGSHGWRNRR